MSSLSIALKHPANWRQTGHWDYMNQTPGKSGIWKNTRYYVNDDGMPEADFLVVHEDVDSTTSVRIPEGNSVFVTSEEKSAKEYDPDFLRQFDIVVTTRDDIKHPRVIRTYYFHPWSVRKTYDELLEIEVDKTRELSAVISSSTWLPGHKARFAFVNKLKVHFDGRLDWFSKGENTFVVDKWDGLATYNYSIAIENSVHPNYFTEKISDCYLANTMPLYAGCPNIYDFFDDRSYLLIDTKDFSKSVKIIESAILDGLITARAPFIADARRLVLEKYHFVAAVTDLLAPMKSAKSKVRKVIKPSKYFVEESLTNRFKRAARIILYGT